MTLRDLADYRAEWVAPVTGTLKNGDYEVISPPPPSSGDIVLLILKILDGKCIVSKHLTTMIYYLKFTITSFTRFEIFLKYIVGYFMKGDNLKTKEARLLTYHRLVEAFKFAFAKRSELGDIRKVNLDKVATSSI